jgi:hypothetical protein
MHYLGINRKETSLFLKKDGNYQISRQYQKIVNKPILAKTSNERWSADCIHIKQYGLPHMGDVNLTGHALFILTVVDYFSKKVWARALRRETCYTVRTAFSSICTAAHTFPHLIQLDNGKAFTGQVFQTWLNNHNIEVVHSTSHQPTTNGMVERMNKEIRKKISEGLITNNNFEWVTHLQEYCDNINNQKSSTTNHTPNELWEQGYDAPAQNNIDFNLKATDHSTNEEIAHVAQAKLVKNAQNMLANGNPPHVFTVGDRVRIKLTSLFATARARMKSQLKRKYFIIRYTPEEYEIRSVLPFVHPVAGQVNNAELWDIRRHQYTLNTTTVPPQVVIVSVNNQTAKKFFGSELQLIQPNNIAPAIQDRFRAQIINRF